MMTSFSFHFWFYLTLVLATLKTISLKILSKMFNTLKEIITSQFVGSKCLVFIASANAKTIVDTIWICIFYTLKEHEFSPKLGIRLFVQVAILYKL